MLWKILFPFITQFVFYFSQRKNPDETKNNELDFSKICVSLYISENLCLSNFKPFEGYIFIYLLYKGIQFRRFMTFSLYR